MTPRIALDCRVADHKASSYSRVLDLWRLAARAVDLEYEEWRAGPCAAPLLLSPTPNLGGPQPGGQVRRLPMLHDVNPLRPRDRSALSRWRAARRFRAGLRLLESSATRLLTVSESARASIAREVPGLASRLRVIPNFAAPSFTPEGRVTLEVQSELSCQLPNQSVLLVAALRRHKNWELLLRAWAALPRALRAAHPLILAGDSRRAHGRPRAIARRLGVDQDLYVPGRIDESVLPTLYRSAAVFVFPSHAEGFGLPPLEAMACGTPVIASSRGSLPEVLGRACLYVDGASTSELRACLLRVLSSETLRSDLKLRGVQRASTWNAERTGRALQAVIAEVLGYDFDSNQTVARVRSSS